MTDQPINGVADLREQLAQLTRRYIQHLDSDAHAELHTLRIEATGPNIHLVYAEHNEQPPSLTVAINALGAVPPEPPEAGREGRRFGL